MRLLWSHSLNSRRHDVESQPEPGTRDTGTHPGPDTINAGTGAEHPDASTAARHEREVKPTFFER